MNKKTIITALVALVAMSADAQRLNKDVERMQYVYALKVVINDSVWSGFADKQYDVPLLYYGDTCCYVVNPTEKFLAMYPSVLIHRDYNIHHSRGDRHLGYSGRHTQVSVPATTTYVFPNFAQKNCHQGFSKSVFVCIKSV